MHAAKRYTRRLIEGDFSQGQAFWAILIPSLLLVKAGVALLSLMNVIPNPVISTRIWLPIAFITLVVLIPLLFASTLRAIWISARLFKGGRQSALLCAATVFLIGLFSLELLNNRARLVAMVQIALKQDHYSLELTQQNDRLMLEGALAYDSTQQVRNVLEQNPDITTVVLNLTGGHLHEARQLSSLITQQQLDTEVKDECSGTCMLAFVGGLNRTAWPDATLRFHRTVGYDNGYRSDWVIKRERAADRQLYYRRGVAESYLHPIFYPQRNDAYLEPGLEVLRNTGVVTQIADRAPL